MPAGLDQHPLARMPRCLCGDDGAPRRDCRLCGGVGLILDGAQRSPAPRRRRLAPRETFALVAVCTYALLGAMSTGAA